MSYNIPYQVGSRAGCVGVETRASETGFERAGEMAIGGNKSQRAADEYSPQRIAYWLIFDITTRIKPWERAHLDYIGARS